jgi:putative nucleotidyltransferase with HDIG domain
VHLARTIRRGDEALAKALLASAQRICAVALSGISPAARTVAGEVVVVRFVERFAAAVGAGDWTVLLTWVDATCERYAAILPLVTLFAGALNAIAAEIAQSAAAGLDALELDVVAGELERLASRPRLVRESRGVDPIDEIDVVLDDLVARLDSSDPLTAEHSRAVSAWCARLAKRLALSKSDAIHVARCGLVHDVGKIMTPPQILNAPRALGDEEMAIMRRHAEDGAKIVAATPLALALVPSVRHHHERFDGHGYPDGLRGGGIVRPARIVAVADAFNAMIGRRPYRPPFPPAAALERLNDNRGTQFDPIVVDAMIDVVTNRS